MTALMDNRKATFNPRQTETGLVIDIVGDNRGRGDIGDMNFKIQLPVRSSVDLETRSGQINVSNIQGDLVRAHIWTSGDIRLSGVNAARVFASNTSGDIFFDGEFAAGGTYEFKSGRGTISLQLPANCGFHLVATAPVKKISMGPFWHDGMKLMGEGRRITGDVGDGRASVTVTNYQGDIQFFPPARQSFRPPAQSTQGESSNAIDFDEGPRVCLRVSFICSSSRCPKRQQTGSRSLDDAHHHAS